MSKGKKIVAWAVGAVCVAALAAPMLPEPAAQAPIEAPNWTMRTSGADRRIPFSDVVEDSLPSVAFVSVLQRADEDAMPDLASPEFLEFLRRLAPRLADPKNAPPELFEQDEGAPIPPARTKPALPKLPQAKRPLQNGVGSAFFIDEQHLLTNAHVVARAERVELSFSNEQRRLATVVGLDERTDIALLRVEPLKGDRFKPLRLGDPEAARVGDPVLAIGSPFGFGFSASSGILSAKGRVIADDEIPSYVPLLQTDAAINPGNSGGPLFDQAGRVIGVTSQIYSRSGGSMGMAFAIPIDQALSVAQRIKARGFVEHGSLGVSIQELTPELAEALGMPGRRGAVIMGVEPGSAAQKAGLLVDDAIVGQGGRPWRSANEMLMLIAGNEPGFKVDLDIIRQGKSITIQAVTGSRPGAKAAKMEPAAQAARPAFGLRAEPLSSKQAKALGVDQGLLIKEASDSPDSGGLQAGDVILSVNRRPAGSLKDLDEAAKAVGTGRPAALLVRRGGRVFYAAPKA